MPNWLTVAHTGGPSTPGGSGSVLTAMGFLLGWNGGPATGDDIGGHRYVNFACTPYSLRVGCSVAPSGGDYSVTIHRVRGGASAAILQSALVLTAGSFTVATSSFAQGIAFQPGDYLKVSCVMSGGAAPSSVFVELLSTGEI